MKYRKREFEGELEVMLDMRCRCSSGEVLSGYLRFPNDIPRRAIGDRIRALRREMQAEMATHERAPR